MVHLPWRLSFIITIFLLCLFVSCDSKRFYEENTRIEKNVWKSGQKVSFDVVIDDNRSTYSFFINLRNTGNYPFSNIFLFLRTTFPDKRISVDTIECPLADNEGRWLGTGITDVKFNRLLFQRGVRFPQSGLFRFEIEQAMRVKELIGISEVGIRLEKD